MKNLILAFATALLAAGCGDTPKVTLNDMSSKGDALMMMGDMTPLVKVGCNGFVDCVNDYFNNNPMGDLSGALTTCSKQAKAGVQNTFLAALSCGQDYCSGANDAGNPRCKLSTDMTKYVNLDGTDANNGTPCGDCLNNAINPLFKQACSQPTSADCNACSTLVNKCLNDMP